MRIGTNPAKDILTLPAHKRHRIIVPVYVPSYEGYFVDAAEVFRMSLDSLLATVDPDHVAITIIDNACIPEVADMLDKALAAGQIDRLARNAVNRGKVAAVAGELLASYEPFVTLADADVLFLHGWLAEVEQVFRTWPAAGSVSPGGQPGAAFYQNDTTWAYAALTARLRSGKFVPDEDMRQFAHSVGNPGLYAEKHFRKQFALARGGMHALVGGGHFVITLRRQCYDGFRFRPTSHGAGPQGMRQIDAPVDRNGWLRLSTTRAHVLHLGNSTEPWMWPRVDEQLASPFRPLASDIDWPAAGARKTGTRIPRPLAKVLAYPAKLMARFMLRRERGVKSWK